MAKWIVAGSMVHYPWIEEYENYDDAKKAYDDNEGNEHHEIFLAEIRESKQN